MNVQVKDGSATVVCGDVLVGLWLAPITMSGWKWHFMQLQEIAGGHAEGALYLNVILPSSSPPDAAVRLVMQADLRGLGPGLRKLIAVPLGDGMWINIVRAIVRGVLLVSGQSKRATVVGTVSDALEHVKGLAGPQTPSSAVLKEAVDALFRRLAPSQGAA
jgi:hypothetical protein